MYVNKDTVAVTTDASGDAIVYSGVINGRILSIKYTKTDFGAGTSPVTVPDFTITTEVTDQNIWVESNVSTTKQIAPRQATHSTVGVASNYSSTNSEPIEDFIYVFNERIKIIVDEGGDTKTGSFDILWG